VVGEKTCRSMEAPQISVSLQGEQRQSRRRSSAVIRVLRGSGLGSGGLRSRRRVNSQ
jgi:hypothetical protein